MTKYVRNSASPSRTCVGGAEGVLMAVRNSPSTMMIRVKQVIISSIAGRKASEDKKSSVCRLSDQR